MSDGHGGPPRHSVSVTGVVIHPEDGRVLMIQRVDDARWVPPGGVLELNETPEKCVVREVREETGVDVTAERLIGVYKNMVLGVVSLAMRCHPTGGEPRSTPEASTAAWLSVEEAIAAAPEARAVRITDAFRDDGPFVRVHDGAAVLTADGVTPLYRPES